MSELILECFGCMAHTQGIRTVCVFDETRSVLSEGALLDPMLLVSSKLAKGGRGDFVIRQIENGVCGAKQSKKHF